MSHESASRPVDNQTEQPTPISTDTVFDVLAHEHRRIALNHLTQTEEPVPVDALVDTVTDETNHLEDAESTRERIAVIFHHSHLPKMANAGFIEYDENQKKVTVTAAASTIQSALATF